MIYLNIELEQAKEKIKMAILDYNNEINSLIEKSVDEYVTPLNIQQIIKQKSESIINDIIETEIKSYYIHGPGRSLIKNLVYDGLKENLNDQNNKFK